MCDSKKGQAMDSGQRRTTLCIFALLHDKDRKQPWQWKDGDRIDGLTVQTCITAARTDEDYLKNSVSHHHALCPNNVDANVLILEPHHHKTSACTVDVNN